MIQELYNIQNFQQRFRHKILSFFGHYFSKPFCVYTSNCQIPATCKNVNVNECKVDVMLLQRAIKTGKESY